MAAPLAPQAGLILIGLLFCVHYGHCQQILPATNISISNNSEASSSQQDQNYYSSPQVQQQRFRVNVSNICERHQMRATIRINRPFYGLIHLKDKRRKLGCFLEGTGDQTYHLDIHYSLNPSDPQHCGVVAHQMSQQQGASKSSSNQSDSQQQQQTVQQTLSAILVVRLHKSIEFSDDRYFLLSCANRCSRPDCSSTTNGNSNNKANLLTSESIPLPALTASLQHQLGLERQSQQQVVASGRRPLLVTEPTTTNTCDLMLELKFQWLARLCWILAGLFIFTITLVLCLCLTLHKSVQRARQHNKAASMGGGSCPKQQALCASMLNESSENCSWSAATTNTTEDGDESMYHHQQKHQQPLQGRAADVAFAKSRPAELIRRRRSIGAAPQPPEIQVPPVMVQQQQVAPPVNQSNRLGASQRAKSRSQTTIHYEQSQDPFKAVPFSYLDTGDAINAGYYGEQQQQQQHNVTYGMSNPQMVEHHGQMATQRQMDGGTKQHHWSIPFNNEHNNYITQPPAPPPPPPPTSSQAVPQAQQVGPMEQESRQQQPISQFDPQNSRQLIDLIQHKHRQQMFQANRTAATIKSPNPTNNMQQAGEYTLPDAPMQPHFSPRSQWR